MEGPPLGPGGEDISWPDQVAPRGRKASSTRKIKPQPSNLPGPMDQALEGGLSPGPLSQLPELRVGPALPPLFLGGACGLGRRSGRGWV